MGIHYQYVIEFVISKITYSWFFVWTPTNNLKRFQFVFFMKITIGQILFILLLNSELLDPNSKLLELLFLGTRWLIQKIKSWWRIVSHNNEVIKKNWNDHLLSFTYCMIYYTLYYFRDFFLKEFFFSIFYDTLSITQCNVLNNLYISQFVFTPQNARILVQIRMKNTNF
jgi:hypothetical protein